MRLNHDAASVHRGLRAKKFANSINTASIVTRYEKTARNYLALVQLACAWLWLS